MVKGTIQLRANFGLVFNSPTQCSDFDSQDRNCVCVFVRFGGECIPPWCVLTREDSVFCQVRGKPSAGMVSCAANVAKGIAVTSAHQRIPVLSRCTQPLSIHIHHFDCFQQITWGFRRHARSSRAPFVRKGMKPSRTEQSRAPTANRRLDQICRPIAFTLSPRFP